MEKKGPTLGERELIDSLRARSRTTHNRRVRMGIGDDCAILIPPDGHEILVTTDFSLETIHFRREWHTPESVGHVCLARGLSDLAAMGAKPLGAFLSLALPVELLRSRRGQPAWRDRFLNGFLALAERFAVPLAGGDTASSPATQVTTGSTRATSLALADVVLVGSAPRNCALLRSGAKPGDLIYVTGHLGGSAAELTQLTTTPHRFRNLNPDTIGEHPHLFPQPRLAVGAWLMKNRRASAAIDISDGLSTDLDHLCQESNLAAVVDAAAIPVHPLVLTATQNAEAAQMFALNGGEDYELLFTAAPSLRIPSRIAGIPVICIGKMRRYTSAKPRMVLAEQQNGRVVQSPLLPHGWEHYKTKPR